MSEFDKWWEENCMILSSDRTEAEDIYNLGVESQQAKINDSENTRAVLYRENIDIREKNIDLQAKIDDLQKKYDAMYNAFTVADDCRKEWHESYMSVRKGRDELQARVNKSIQALEQSKPHMMRQYDAMQALSILKGNKDEN